MQKQFKKFQVRGGFMYVSLEMMATKYSVSVATVRRIIKEMEQSGRYIGAIKRVGKTEVNDEDFEHYVCRRKRRNTVRASEESSQ